MTPTSSSTKRPLARLRKRTVLSMLAAAAALGSIVGSGVGSAQAAVDGTIRVDGRAFRDFGPMKWGTNASFFLHPYYLNAQLASRGSQATEFMRFPGGIAAQDWGWASCELSATPGAVTYGTPCYPTAKRNLTTDPLIRTSEFFKWSNSMGTDQLVITLNANATMKENAALLAFSNGTVTDTRVIGVDQLGVDWKTVGFWAQKRVDAGVVAPMGIKTWEFGNETMGGKGLAGCLDFGWETVWTCNSVEFYEGIGTGATRRNGYAETKTLLKTIDPTIRVGIPGTQGELNTANPWMQPLFNRAGTDIDFLIVHTYYQYSPPPNTPAGNATILAFPETKLPELDQQLSVLEANAGITRKTPVLMSEYGLTSEGWQEQTGMRLNQIMNAMMIGDSIGQMGLNDRFIGSNQFTMYYDYSFGNEFGLMGFKDANYQDAYRYPTYYAMALWKRFGTTIKGVATTFNASTDLSIYAGQKNGNTTLMVINKTNTAKTATISIDGKTILSEYADTFAGTNINDTLPTYNGKVVPNNDFSDAPGTTTNRGGATSYNRSFPPASITLLELDTGTSTATTTSTTTTSTTTTTTTTPPPPVSPFVAFSPARLMDSRPGEQTVDTQMAGTGLLQAGTTTQLQLIGRAGIPADASTVWLNVAVTQPAAAGFLTLFPCGTTLPTSSNVNFSAGMTIAASVPAGVGAGGKTCIYASATTHVVVDASAYSRSVPFFTSTTPARLMDTRAGQFTIDGQFAGIGIRPAGFTTELTIANRGGISATPNAVALNIAVTEPTTAGFVTVYPCGSPLPLASNLNFVAGQTIANSVAARLGTAGKICVYSSAQTHIVVDANGYYPSTSPYTGQVPARFLDTRPGQFTADGQQAGGGLLVGGTTLELTVGGRNAIPANAYAVTLNLAVTQPSSAGFVTIYPCGTALPLASNINFNSGDTISNAAMARLGASGKVCLYSSATTHVVVDINGYIP